MHHPALTRLRRLSLLLIVSTTACHRDAGQRVVLDSSPIPGFREIGSDTTGFAASCRGAVDVTIASDSPFLSVLGTVDFDRNAGILITDPVEKRIFEFRLDGRLIRSFGAPGTNPGEFLALEDAIYAPQGRVIALDGRLGLTEFDQSGHVISISIGKGLEGGSMLAHLGSHGVVVGLGAAAVRDSVPAMLVRTYDMRGERVLGGYETETRERLRGFMLFRGVRVGADPTGGLTVATVPYQLGFDVFRPDGTQVASSQLTAADYHPPVPHPTPFATRDEADQWVLQSSYVDYVALPDSNHVLLSWQSYPGRELHRYAGMFDRKTSKLLAVQEIPYRLVRSAGDTLVFVKPTSTSRYQLVVCPHWAPQPSRPSSSASAKTQISGGSNASSE